MSIPAPGPISGNYTLSADELAQILPHDSSGGLSSGHLVFLIIGIMVIFTAILGYFMTVFLCKDSQYTEILNPHADIGEATVDRFLQNMSKEKPHRYTAQQLEHYTRNCFHKLGSGGFGVVYRGLLPEGVVVAVKVLNNNLTKQVEEQFMAEVNSIGRTYHRNLVRLYGYCFEPKLKALVYEFMPNGSLDHLLFGEFRLVLDWSKRHSIAVGTAKAIAYLHEECEQKIIHHDIKPGNVLLDSGMNPKVADFGLARFSNRDNTHLIMSGFKGTPGYAAPEVWTSYVTHKCDVYSFGMMLFEIIGRRRNHMRELSGTTKEWLPRWTYEKIRVGEVAEMLGEFGVEGEQQAERALKVALWCVQYSPGARPEMSDVVKMLEGGMEVPSPPNPFAYLEQTFEFGAGSSDRSAATSSFDQECAVEKCATFPQVQERKIDVLIMTL